MGGDGRELIEHSPTFAAKLAECEEALEPYVDFSLAEILRSDQEQWLERIEVVQPVLFATMVALAELWRSYGVEPGAVVGHSQGEIAAAQSPARSHSRTAPAGRRLRSQAIAKLAGKGAMVSVALSAEALEERLERWGGEVTLAAINGPGAGAVACGAEVLAQFLAACEEEGVRARAVPADHPLPLAPGRGLREEVLELLAPTSPLERRGPSFYSTVTGGPIDTTALDAEYWYRNLREPVRFEQATRQLLADGFTALIEISPHPVLAMAVEQTAEAETGDPAAVAVLHTLRRGEGGPERFLAALGERPRPRRRGRLGALLQRHRRHAPPSCRPTPSSASATGWRRGGGAGDARVAGSRRRRAPAARCLDRPRRRGPAAAHRPHLPRHPPLAQGPRGRRHGVLPGSRLRRAGPAGRGRGRRRAPGGAGPRRPRSSFPSGSGAAAGRPRTRGEEEGGYAIAIYSRPQALGEGGEAGGASLEPPRHRSLTFAGAAASQDFDAIAWPPPGAEPLDIEAFYDLVAEVGIDYGPAFQGLEAAWRRGEELFAEVSLASEQVRKPSASGSTRRCSTRPCTRSASTPIPAEGLRLPFGFERRRPATGGGRRCAADQDRASPEERISLHGRGSRWRRR